MSGEGSILLHYICLKRQSCPDSTYQNNVAPGPLKKKPTAGCLWCSAASVIVPYIFWAFWNNKNKEMIMTYDNLKNLLKRIPKAWISIIKSWLRTQNTISFLNSSSSTELVMFYWCIISGRWTNLISCHQGLKSCSGSSSKERVFLEGCPDTLSLFYYFPYSSSQSNYSDKSLKQLTALPGKMEP